MGDQGTPVKTEATEQQVQQAGQAAVQAAVGGAPAAPPPENATDLINQKDQARLANQLAKLIAKSMKTKKETKADINARRVQAAAATLLSGKLQFQMKLDQNASRLSLECTNLKAQVSQIAEAMKAAKSLAVRRGRGRGRRRAGAGNYRF